MNLFLDELGEEAFGFDGGDIATLQIGALFCLYVCILSSSIVALAMYQEELRFVMRWVELESASPKLDRNDAVSTQETNSGLVEDH
ncbi:hypothetical protein SESBI_12765 [Sesbania bispinosa]|nr:hypothetical protein SESBI_12765 [Sesbania bispinosa]